MNFENWPSITGRYYIGNKESPVSICTLADIDLLENFKDSPYMNKIAIIGKTVTENVGIEKIVQNIVANPNIRYLIICGRDSHGHYVGQAIISLIKNGVKDGRIVGATGPMPIVKNLSEEEVETFRQQVRTIDLTNIDDMEKIAHTIDQCLEEDPGPFTSAKKIEKKEVETIIADYDPQQQFSADQQKDVGWFAISVNRQKGLIVVDYYKGYGEQSRFQCRIIGEGAEAIAGTIVKRGLITQLYHATYLGKELAKAEIALRNNLPYEQETELPISKSK